MIGIEPTISCSQNTRAATALHPEQSETTEHACPKAGERRAVVFAHMQTTAGCLPPR